jgi:hypothetical protein
VFFKGGLIVADVVNSLYKNHDVIWAEGTSPDWKDAQRLTLQLIAAKSASFVVKLNAPPHGKPRNLYNNGELGLVSS